MNTTINTNQFFACGASPLLAHGPAGLNVFDKIALRASDWYYAWSGLEPAVEEDELDETLKVTTVAEPTILEAA